MLRVPWHQKGGEMCPFKKTCAHRLKFIYLGLPCAWYILGE